MTSAKDKLRVLDGMDTPNVWHRARSLTPLRDPEVLRIRLRTGRLTAGVTAIAVFIAAGAFAWSALRPKAMPQAGSPDDPAGAILWPDRSTEQLQASQAQVDAGNPDYAWRLDPKHVATHFADQVLGWGTPASPTIGDAGYMVILDPSWTENDPSALVTVTPRPIHCLSLGVPSVCPPPYEEEHLLLERTETAGGNAAWSVAEVRAAGFGLALRAGDRLRNGEPISGHVVFPSSAWIDPSYDAQYGFNVTGGGECVTGSMIGFSRHSAQDISFPASIGKVGWALDGCQPEAVGFAYVASGSVPICPSNVYGCPVAVLVSLDLRTPIKPLFGLTVVPITVSVGTASPST